MAKDTELNERSRAILMQVINNFIATGEPVGSRTVAKEHAENLSPATIRNVMSDLEDEGFLKQPHTSAGRVPTDKGYRYFVDQLLLPYNSMDPREGMVKNYNHDMADRNLEEVLERACNLLSSSSNNAGLVMIPGFSQMLFKHIEFIKITRREALAVFISELGVLQNKIIPIKEDIPQEELTSISNYLNQEFSGKSVKAIRNEILNRIKTEKNHFNKLMTRAADLWTKAFQDENEDNEILVDGILNFFDHPEFASDLDKMKSLFQALEEKSKLVKLLDLCLERDGMTIIIGEENSEKEMQNCSLIAQNYRLGAEKMGTMAVFGPKRMDYKNVIPLVNQTAKMVSMLLSKNNLKN